MSKLLVIVGITGTQGSSVYNVFKHEPGWRIRGITRDPNKHQALQKEGVQLAKADLDNPDSLDQAFSGANAIFAMTNFFEHIFNDPTTFEKAEKESRDPNEIAMEREAEQGRNIIHAAAKNLDTLDRLVFSTLSDARKWSNGEMDKVYHFQGTASSTQYLKEKFPNLAKKTSYLQLTNFFSNWKFLAPVMFSKQSDNSMLIRYHIAENAMPQPFVDAAHDTGHFVRSLVLSEKAPPGTTMAGYRDHPITIERYAVLWGKVNHRKVSYRPYTLQEAIEAGMPKWLMAELLHGAAYQSKYGCDGGDPEVKSPEECGVDMSKLPSIEDWMRTEDWSSVI